MSQSDVLKLLKKNKGKWMSSKEIAEIVGIQRGCIINNLNVLRKYNEVEMKEEKYRLRVWRYKE